MLSWVISSRLPHLVEVEVDVHVDHVDGAHHAVVVDQAGVDDQVVVDDQTGVADQADIDDLAEVNQGPAGGLANNDQHPW